MSPKTKYTLTVPGDKSIGHRVLMFSALMPGEHMLHGLPQGADVRSTRTVLETLGCHARIIPENDALHWAVPEHWTPPAHPLDCGNSGTTMRLMSGLLAGQQVPATLVGDASLSARPMARVLDPLRQMGAPAKGVSTAGKETAPLTLAAPPTPLQGLTYTLPVASAQVKSALLLAGCFAQGETVVIEPIPTRDHTERLLKWLCPRFQSTPHPEGGWMHTITGQPENHPFTRPVDAPADSPLQWHVPGDPSSAAFWAVLALGGFRPAGQNPADTPPTIRIPNVLINPTRIGLVKALQAFGADIRFDNPRTWQGEPVADWVITPTQLVGQAVLGEADIPALIDELPILAVAACFADGTLTVTGAEELRHKESDRLAAIVEVLGGLGAAITEAPDGFSICGNPHWQPPAPTVALPTYHDHRLVMSWLVLNARVSGADMLATPWPIADTHWADVSFPGFVPQLHQYFSP